MKAILKATTKTYNVGNDRVPKLYVFIPKLFRDALGLKPKEGNKRIIKIN